MLPSPRSPLLSNLICRQNTHTHKHTHAPNSFPPCEKMPQSGKRCWFDKLPFHWRITCNLNFMAQIVFANQTNRNRNLIFSPFHHLYTITMYMYYSHLVWGTVFRAKNVHLRILRAMRWDFCACVESEKIPSIVQTLYIVNVQWVFDIVHCLCYFRIVCVCIRIYTCSLFLKSCK